MCPAPPDPSPIAVDGRRREPPILVSACLLGVPCNHRGGANPTVEVAALAAGHRLIPVCPEVAGGLETPRSPAERQPDDRVCTVDGEEVTDAYRRGANHAVRIALAVGADRAVLKARSPSCGSDAIYDGSFRRILVPGQGVTAEALRGAGVVVCSEEDLDATGTLGASPGA